jgi:CubicO group peptidase (beta-lactamase class C family)
LTSISHRIDEMLHRRAAVGLAVGVVRDGHPMVFHGHGLADIASATPITEDTVFRVGSVTKLFTAIAVMQLWEAGRVELDAPADAYLRGFTLEREQPRWRPVTLRHLMTHTSGIPEVRGIGDLLNASLTPAGGRPATLSVRFGDPLPSLAEYYRDGLRSVVEPGTAFAYCNHGFATLGQIVEDMSGMTLSQYIEERILRPLGMADSGLVRTGQLAARLATGYSLGRRGPSAVADREWVDGGAGQLYATARDMGRFAAALLGRGANEHGRILEPSTLSMMLEPHFQPDPRIPGIGLAFFRGEVGGHRTAGHDGILPGFNAGLLLAPDDGVGLFALTNTGGAFGWLQIELERLLRELLAASEDRSGVPQHPEIWPDLCGRYVFLPRIADLRNRLILSGGVEVVVVGGRLVVRLLTPVPVPSRGLPLEPDDEHDADVFRLDLARHGIAPIRVVFARGTGRYATAAHTDLGGQPWSLVRRPDARIGRRWLGATLGAAAAAGAVAVARRRRESRGRAA